MRVTPPRERALAQELDGKVRVFYEPTGIVCVIEASLPADQTQELTALISKESAI